MIYKIIHIEDSFVEDVFKQSMEDLNLFYEIDWRNHLPKIIIVNNRQDIDLLKGEKTEDWIVGWSEGKSIYVLDRGNLEKESNHKYKPETYKALIKHELSHSFYNIKSKGRNTPRWLCEGVAIYTSGQNKFKKIPTEFHKFLSFYNIGGDGIYSESGFVVQILVEKYGKEKLLELISSLNVVKDEKGFLELFEKRYGFTPNYKEFNSFLEKTK